MKYNEDNDALNDVGFFTAALLLCAAFVAVMYWIVPPLAQWMAS